MREGRGLRRLIVAVVCAYTLAVSADEAGLLRGLDTDDAHALAGAVTAIEQAPATPDLADVLFAAGRACEDRLYDPARALRIYQRIVRELPDAGVSISAARRIDKLKGLDRYPREAAELAQLKATADQLPFDEVVRRTDALVLESWPGNSDAAIWLGDWLCRTKRFSLAQARYTLVTERWPGTDVAQLALRNAAGCAIDGHDWSLADALTARLPANDEVERLVRADLFASAERGRFRDRLHTAAWIAVLVALAGLLASLGEAMWRGGLRRPPWRPPVEVLFLAPVAAVIVFASFTAHRSIAPAVTRISIVGVVLAWLSGVALDLLRARGRAIRTRALLHVAACVIGVVSIGYIALTRDGLLEMLVETVKFGPRA